MADKKFNANHSLLHATRSMASKVYVQCACVMLYHVHITYQFGKNPPIWCLGSEIRTPLIQMILENTKKHNYTISA